MADYKAPLRDVNFVLFEAFKAQDQWANLPALAETVDKDTAEAILEEGAKLTEKEIAPLNRSGDEEGAQWDNGAVTTPAGFKEAYKQYSEGGWCGLTGSPDHGGMGMPKALSVHFEEMMFAANTSLAIYPGLTQGACLALLYHGSDALKEQYLPMMYSGEWAGSMCLTEPHCGTDLGLMKTKAVPQEDGSFEITGTKIFISGGEQDLTDNIIHLVLAKLPDAPAGPKGISLFLVPKLHVNEDGSLGEANAVTCGSIEHKMGIKASATCVMNFDGAKGYLVGEPNRGLNAMFTMMNYERLGIGLQGIGNAEMSYQIALEYAKERLQGRSMTGVKNPDGPADPIIVHGDIRRMLLNMKSLIEGSRAFATYVAQALDESKFTTDSEAKGIAEAKVALLTPVAKAFFTDMGFDSTVAGQQVLGGHGFIREWGQEQNVRDCRIAQIYEGTNGIQALDLLGRKIAANGGKFAQLYFGEIRSFIEENKAQDALAEFTAPLADSLNRLEKSTMNVLTAIGKNKEEMSTASVEYLHAFGYVSYAYMWAIMAKTALDALDAGTTDTTFYNAKVKTARYYMKRVLPRIDSLFVQMESGADALYDFDEAEF